MKLTAIAGAAALVAVGMVWGSDATENVAPTAHIDRMKVVAVDTTASKMNRVAPSGGATGSMQADAGAARAVITADTSTAGSGDSRASMLASAGYSHSHLHENGQEHECADSDGPATD